MRLVRVLPGISQCLALAQQVPTPIQLYINLGQPLSVGFCKPRAIEKPMLLICQTLNVTENRPIGGFVFHRDLGKLVVAAPATYAAML